MPDVQFSPQFRRREDFHSDRRLRKLDSEDHTPAFLGMLNRWRTAHDKAMGTQVMSADDRRAVREEVRWGLRWLRAYRRAVEMRLPIAAAECAMAVAEVNISLCKYMDTWPERNALIPFVRKAQKRTQESKDGGLRSGKKRQSKAQANQAAIRREYVALKKRYGNSVGMKFIISSIRRTLGVSERTIFFAMKKKTAATK